MLRCLAFCSRCQTHATQLTNATLCSLRCLARRPVQFADTGHWLRYFPPLAMRDLKLMGCGIDWRRRWVWRGGGAGLLVRAGQGRPGQADACAPGSCQRASGVQTAVWRTGAPAHLCLRSFPPFFSPFFSPFPPLPAAASSPPTSTLTTTHLCAGSLRCCTSRCAVVDAAAASHPCVAVGAPGASLHTCLASTGRLSASQRGRRRGKLADSSTSCRLLLLPGQPCCLDSPAAWQAVQLLLSSPLSAFHSSCRFSCLAAAACRARL